MTQVQESNAVILFEAKATPAMATFLQLTTSRNCPRAAHCTTLAPVGDQGTNLAVGLIGTGAIAQVHAESLAKRIPGVTLVAVASESVERARAFAETHEIPRALGSHEALFEDDLDAVVIASATETHGRLAEQAARRKLHVFCEKPLGVSAEEIDSMLSAVSKSGTRLAIGFNRRFDAEFHRAHDRIADGSIGAPEAIVIISRDPGPPSVQELATPGRLFLGTMIHDFDMARFLMQDEVVSVSTYGSVLGNDAFKALDQADSAIASMQFSRGGLGTIVNSWNSNEGYDQRVELHGSKGLTRVNNVTSAAPDADPDAPFFVQRYAASFLAELEAFFNALRGETWDPALATGTDGKTASLLAQAAFDSWKRQSVIRL